MNTVNVLNAIPSTEPADFNEFMRALSDDFDGDWRELFKALDFLEAGGLVEIDRSFNNRINTLQLTEAGVVQVKENR